MNTTERNDVTVNNNQSERQMAEPVANAAPADATAVATRFLECVGGQDLDGMTTLFADEIDWFVPGSSGLPWSGRRTRGNEVADFFAVMWTHFVPGESKPEITDIVCDGTNVVITGTFTHVVAANSKQFTTPVAMHLKTDGGKITYLKLYEDTLLISQAFDIANDRPAVGPHDAPKSLGANAKG